MSFNAFMLKKISERRNSGLLRKLKVNSPTSIDFSSNDYLGVAKVNSTGSTGSRLISGNSREIEDLENKFSSLVGSKTALFFSSGYQANVGLIPALCDRETTIFYDELIHASLRDGVRLSLAKNISFKHNDLDHLESKLSNSSGKKIIIVEAVYSMDGDSPNIQAITELAKHHSAELIVDEAHSFGIAGANGLGLIEDKNLSSDILATIYPLGKAVGSSGCFVTGSEILREYLINFCRSFIYSTAPSLSIVKEVSKQLNQISSFNRTQVIKNKDYFLLNTKVGSILTGENSAIVSIKFKDVQILKEVENALLKNGIAVKAILYPTVPKGTERLRICFHSFNSKEEIDLLITIINQTN